MDQLDTEVSSIADIREKIEAAEVNSPESTPEPAEKASETQEKPAESGEKAPEIAEKEAEKPASAEVIATPKNTFQPDFKVRVGGKDHDIPERFRGLITDETSQKEIKELFEKALGLDDAKPRHQKMKERVEHYEKEVIPSFTKQNEIIKELAMYVDKNDFTSYFDRLGVPVQKIQQWMLQELSLTPDQKAIYNQNRELQKQMYQRETENLGLKQTADAAKQEIVEAQRNQMLSALDFTLTNKSEYKETVKAFDMQNGAGSFKDQVIKYAQFVYNTEGKDLSIDDSVQGYIKFRSLSPAMANQASQSGVVNPKDKPVLPVTNAKPVSPVAKQISSINQIREKAKNFHAE